MIAYMLYYCKKCGRQIGFEAWDKRERICNICNSQLFEIPHEYTDNFRWRDGDGKQAVIEELVKPSPEFDQYLFDHRDEILAQKSAEFNAKMTIGKAIVEEKGRVPKCPTCGSTNIRKMSGVERGASIAAFGIFSKKINKTFKCGNCGYTW